MARRYRLQKRALRKDETRRCIIDAAVYLHTTIGPAMTNISAIAKKAGVERLTIYRHFPTEHELLTACSGDYLEKHPPPDPASWRTILDPFKRLAHALGQLTSYYDQTERRWALVQRDAQLEPGLRKYGAPYRQRWGEMKDALAEGLVTEVGDPTILHAWLGHVLDFKTWISLVREQGLTPDQVIELQVRTARCLVSSRRP